MRENTKEIRKAYEPPEKMVKDTSIETMAFMEPKIPKGFEYVNGKWKSGFIIRRQEDGSLFVWIPVAGLQANGILGGKQSSRFGRRNFMGDEFGKKGFHEEIDRTVYEQFVSVRKYGGFWTSCFDISVSEDRKAQSKQGFMPWALSYEDAKYYSRAYCEDNEEISSHLMYGVEYDTISEWLRESGVVTWQELVVNSKGLGNTRNMENPANRILPTGSNKDWCLNGLWDYYGNVLKMTKEKYDGAGRFALRGSYYLWESSDAPIATRSIGYMNSVSQITGFRICLTMK